jgi:hypothetical protein
MSRIVIDATLPEKLLTLVQPVELCDGGGRVVGRFVPIVDATRFAELRPQISEKEIARRKCEGGGRTLAKILADLEKRA